MMKFELLGENGRSFGLVTVDPEGIKGIEKGCSGRYCLTLEGGYFYVNLDSRQLAEVYRLLADRLDHEAGEIERVVSTIR